ncbi:MAG: amino acid-binding protein [Candidatus Limnocylindrales bacterium]
MKLQQLSLFVENKPGSLRAPCEALAAADIDLLTMSLADTSSFGIMRFIVREPERARRVLEEAGMVARVSEVVPVEVENKPGGLAAVLAAIEAAGLAVEYMYDFGAASHGGNAAIIFRFENPDAALAALQAAGVRVLTSEEVLGG